MMILIIRTAADHSVPSFFLSSVGGKRIINFIYQGIYLTVLIIKEALKRRETCASPALCKMYKATKGGETALVLVRDSRVETTSSQYWLTSGRRPAAC